MKLEKVIAVRTSKTIYRDGNKAIKVFDKDYSMADILNEALNQARVEETDLSIPKLLEVTTVNDQPAIVTEFVPGKTLERLMEENPEKEDEYLEKFVEIQMNIHSKKAPLLPSQYDKFDRKISQSGFDATTRYDLHSRLDAMKRHDKICHGDFNPSNIIITKDGTPYIIDWAHATRGNASADVARTYLLFWLAGKIELADKYLDLFCKKSDTAKQYVQKWLPIVAASQSVKGKPEEKEFLASWVNVVDYE